jgi:glycosyltransferase involved in cell wall biosynthesis
MVGVESNVAFRLTSVFWCEQAEGRAIVIPRGGTEREHRTRLLHVMTAPQSLYLFLRGQIQYMTARGFELHAVASPGEWLQRFAERDGIPVYAVEMPRRISPFADLIAIFKLYSVIRRVRPEIVQAGTPQGGMLGAIAAWLARVPIRIYHIRGLPLMTATGRKRQLLCLTEKLSCRLSHRVLCVSHSIREVAIAEGLCPPGKIVVLEGGSGNGVDAQERFNPELAGPELRLQVREQHGIPTDAVVLGFIGRLIGIKGINELCAAWVRLRDDSPNLHLLAVGPFEEHDPVPDDVVRSLCTDPRVHLTDRVFDTVPYYAAIDLLVFPTHREGLPNVLLEAGAMGLAAVATRVPGCIDVIEDGATGTLVPLQEVDAIVAAVRTYLADPQLRRKHGQAARARILREFRQEAIWEALAQEYGRLLRDRRRPLPAALARVIENPVPADQTRRGETELPDSTAVG